MNMNQVKMFCPKGHTVYVNGENSKEYRCPDCELLKSLTKIMRCGFEQCEASEGLPQCQGCPLAETARLNEEYSKEVTNG